MKELWIVYAWLLLVTLAGCSVQKAATYDPSRSVDRRAMEIREGVFLLELTDGKTLKISEPRVVEDSLFFFISEPDTLADDHEWRLARAKALKDVKSIVAPPKDLPHLDSSTRSVGIVLLTFGIGAIVVLGLLAYRLRNVNGWI